MQGRHYSVKPLIAQMTVELCLRNRPKSTGGTHTGDRLGPVRVSALSVRQHRLGASSQRELGKRALNDSSAGLTPANHESAS